jgi:predicted dehydrogenase
MEKVVLVGFGEVARTLHAPVWAEGVDGACLSSVVDVNDMAREAAKERYSVRTSASISQMLEHDRPDIAVVATDAPNHFSAAMQLLENGVHVICEKPLAVTDLEAWTMVNEAHRRRVKLTVHHQSCFSDVFEAGKNAVLSGKIGQVYAANIYGKGRDPSFDLREMVPHQLHWLYEILGKATSVPLKTQ